MCVICKFNQILNLVEFLVLSISTWNQNFEKNGKKVNVSFIIIVIKIDDSLYAFAKKMKQKWQLISETKRAVFLFLYLFNNLQKYDRKREKDINRYKKAVIEWRKEL